MSTKEVVGPRSPFYRHRHLSLFMSGERKKPTWIHPSLRYRWAEIARCYGVNDNIPPRFYIVCRAAGPVWLRPLKTGTPMQNDLDEFFAVADFVNPGLLGSLKTFRSR